MRCKVINVVMSGEIRSNSSLQNKLLTKIQ